MTRIRSFGFLTVLAIPALLVQPALAGTDFSKFPLTKAIPADAFVAVASRANPDRQFLDDHWAGVTKAFMDSGILQDIWDMVIDHLNDEQVEQIEVVQEQFSKLCAQVEWSKLFEKEFLHIGRFVMPMGPTGPYEGVMLGRLDAKGAAENYQALKAILEQIVKFADAHGANGALRLVETKTEDGLTVAGLVPPGLPGPVLAVGYSKDIIAVTFGGHTLLGECMEQLSGKASKPGLTSTERFKNAFAKLPAAKDEVVFFDPSRIFGMASGMVKMFAGMAAQPAAAPQTDDDEANGEPKTAPDSDANEIARAMGGITKLLDDMSIIDCMAAVVWTDGYSVFSESVTSLKPDAKKSPLYGVLTSGGEAAQFDRFVPKEATSFSCGSGISLKKLYHYIREFVTKTVPGGDQHLAMFDRMQREKWELDIEKDILDLFEGPMISIEMNTDWVFLLKVTSEKAAEARIQDLIARINAAMGKDGGLMITPAEVAEGVSFTQVTHPMMMLMGGLQPVIGAAEGHLLLGSNVKAVRRCLETAQGKHANITKNKRWSREGLKPTKGQKVDSISYTDESRTAEEWQAAIGMMSMVMGFATMGMQDAPPQAQAMVQALPPILAKLAPVVGKMDFFQSSAEVKTFDGSQWITRSVQNYKPPKPATNAESTTSEDDEDE